MSDTLFEAITAHYEEDASPYWPGKGEEKVHEEVVDQLRWGYLTEWVYRRGDEYVRVTDVEPATEMQDWGDYGEPTIEVVEPYEVTVTKYRTAGEGA